MTQPVASGTPVVPATPVAVRGGNVYLTSPITGETKEVAPDAAVEMLRSGWVPNTETSAERVRAGQIPAEVAGEQPALGKFGYGVTRGVLTPLVDMALPEGGRGAALRGGCSRLATAVTAASLPPAGSHRTTPAASPTSTRRRTRS